MSEHTPTPWKIRDGQTRQLGYLILSEPVNEAVLETIPSNLKAIDDRITAEFIVRACNNFEALVKAIKILLDEIETSEFTGSLTMVEDIKKIVAEAEKNL